MYRKHERFETSGAGPQWNCCSLRSSYPLVATGTLLLRFGTAIAGTADVDTANISGLSRLKPLVVDLDGTLVRSDLLIEFRLRVSWTQLLSDGPPAVGHMAWQSSLESRDRSTTKIDVSHLPYDENVLSLIQKTRSDGCQVYLASASNERYVQAVADHLGIFDGWFASNANENLSAEIKARRLMDAFGAGGFDMLVTDTTTSPCGMSLGDASQCVSRHR